jgi:TonB family protein
MKKFSSAHSALLLTALALWAQDSPPKVLRRVEPIYANGAVEQRREGTVVLGFTVGLDGKAKDIGTLRTVGWGLDEQSMLALREWRFEPARRNGMPVEERTTAEFLFKLPDFLAALPPTGDIVPPTVLSRQEPEYTPAAIANKIEGVLQLRMVVDTDGVPRSVEIARGLPNGLNEKAIRAMAQWKFHPATRNGVPVAVQWATQFYFRLPEEPTSASPQPITRSVAQTTLSAKRANLQGSVLLDVLVGRDGLARDVRALRGLPHGLTSQAIDAVHDWTFTPGPARLQVEVPFGPNNPVPSREQPKIRRQVPPQTTPEAMANQITGTVILRVEIGADGAPRGMKVLRGLPHGLDQKAMEAVSQWEFEPARQNGVAIPAQATVEVRFPRAR